MNTTKQQLLEADEGNESGLVEQATQTAQEGESERQAEQDPEEAARLAERRRIAMDTIGENLTGMLNEAVQYRAQFERDWIEDIRQFEYGDASNSSYATKQYSADEEHLSAIDNITRPATITYAARLGDMLYPTSDRNWDLDATPNPELPPEVIENIKAGPDGQGLPEAMLDAAIDTVARKRMAKMRQQIDDQLSESRYNDHGREVIMDACKIGHGVLKGPFAKCRRKRRYIAQQGFTTMIVEENTTPCITRVDPWLVFPMPCRRIDDSPGVFELHEMSSKRVEELMHQPGFSRQQVRRVLAMSPSWNSINSTIVSMREIDASSFGNNKNYPVFEYNGQMPTEALVVFLDQLMSETAISEEDASLILAEVQSSNAIHLSCNVWMCQGVVMKLAINPIDAEHNLYKFFVFEEREGSPFGKGVPRLLRDPQRSVRMLWAAILLNSMMASAPQIGVKKGGLVPVGGASGGSAVDLRCTRPRVWAFNDDIKDIREAMQVFVIPSTVGSTMPVYERAKKNGEEQVMLPMIAQGEPTAAVPTSSGLAMLMNASNIVQRRLAARYDAAVTTPVITDFYDWNMNFGEESAKGDYKCIARASSHLLVKDIQAQHFLTALKMFSENPKLEARMKDEAWAEEAMRILDLDFGRFLYTQEELDEMQANAPPPQPTPEDKKADAAVKTAEARVLEAQTRASRAEGETQLAFEDRRLDVEEGERERQSRERIAAMKLQEVLAGMDQDAQIRVMEMARELELADKRERGELRKASMKIAADAQRTAAQIAADRQEADIEAGRPGGPVIS